MPVYRVFVDDKDTGDYVAASSPQDAYADVATALPLTYKSTVRLEEVNSPEARPGFPVGRRTIAAAGLSIPEQQLQLPDPGREECAGDILSDGGHYRGQFIQNRAD